MNDSTKKFPDEWNGGTVYNFQLSWLISKPTPEEKRLFKALNEQFELHISNLLATQKISREEYIKHLKTAKTTKQWSDFYFVHQVINSNLAKFEFMTNLAIWVNDFAGNLGILRQKSLAKSRCISVDLFPPIAVENQLRQAIIQDISVGFFEHPDPDHFEKIYDFGVFGLKVRLFTSWTSGWAETIFSNPINPLHSIPNRYCFVHFYANKEPHKCVELSAGKLTLEGNSVCVGDWIYRFENTDLISGSAFFSVEFYSKQLQGKVEIEVHEDEAGEYYHERTL